MLRNEVIYDLKSVFRKGVVHRTVKLVGRKTVMIGKGDLGIYYHLR